MLYNNLMLMKIFEPLQVSLISFRIEGRMDEHKKIRNFLFLPPVFEIDHQATVLECSNCLRKDE